MNGKIERNWDMVLDNLKAGELQLIKAKINSVLREKYEIGDE